MSETSRNDTHTNPKDPISAACASTFAGEVVSHNSLVGVDFHHDVWERQALKLIMNLSRSCADAYDPQFGFS
jgi:hypothetical protein